MIKPLTDRSLAPWHTFGLAVKAIAIFVVDEIEQVKTLYDSVTYKQYPKLILGEGSNVLFTCDFNGIVIINRIKGITQTEFENHVLVHVQAGECWHDLVQWCLEKKLYGLENLALIPGCAGSAPIQNIGAYGAEFKDFCVFVHVLNVLTGDRTAISNEQCQFGYRDSIFKHTLKENFIITSIELKLHKTWQPKLNYHGLNQLNIINNNASDLFEQVCRLRRSKLPDPKVYGNAGSFFKNPVVCRTLGDALLKKYPDMPIYPVHPTDTIKKGTTQEISTTTKTLNEENSYKLAAGWLIEQVGLKGKQIGGAKVHDNQALVLINYHHATPQDIINCAALIVKAVQEKFTITLETEVRFIGADKEITLSEAMIQNGQNGQNGIASI